MLHAVSEVRPPERLQLGYYVLYEAFLLLTLQGHHLKLRKLKLMFTIA